jgi:hypothetical protein
MAYKSGAIQLITVKVRLEVIIADFGEVKIDVPVWCALAVHDNSRPERNPSPTPRASPMA